MQDSTLQDALQTHLEEISFMDAEDRERYEISEPEPSTEGDGPGRQAPNRKDGIMESYVTIRPGAEPRRFPGEIRNGKLWMVYESQAVPIIDGQAAATAEFGLDRIKKLMKAGTYSAIPADCFASLGDNPSGLAVIPGKDYDRQIRDAAEAAMSDSDRAWWRDVAPLEREIERAENADYYEPARICCARIDYDHAVADWREAYPGGAAEHDVQDLRDKASRKRDLAVGALTYDADGSLSSEMQQQRHNEYIAEAVALEALARELTQ